MLASCVGPERDKHRGHQPLARDARARVTCEDGLGGLRRQLFILSGRDACATRHPESLAKGRARKVASTRHTPATTTSGVSRPGPQGTFFPALHRAWRPSSPGPRTLCRLITQASTSHHTSHPSISLATAHLSAPPPRDFCRFSPLSEDRSSSVATLKLRFIA